MTKSEATIRTREILTAAGFPGPMNLSEIELDEIQRLRATIKWEEQDE